MNSISIPSQGTSGAIQAYRGYEFQILVTVWIALDLIVKAGLTDKITIEPASQEDIEAELLVPPDKAETTCALDSNGARLSIQIKSKSTGPWSTREFAKIVGASRTESTRGSRRRPLDALGQDRGSSFLFITDAAVERGLVGYRVRELSETHQTDDLPPHCKGGAAAVSGRRIRILEQLGEELLLARIRAILANSAHVPIGRSEECIVRFMTEVRKRLLRRAHPEWTIAEVRDVLRSFSGLPHATADMRAYVPPLSYPDIERKLDRWNAVILIGTPGTGKTLTAQKLVLEQFCARLFPSADDCFSAGA